MTPELGKLPENSQSERLITDYPVLAFLPKLNFGVSEGANKLKEMAARQEMLPLVRKCPLILKLISIFNNIQATGAILDVYCEMAPQKHNLTAKKRHLVVIIQPKKG